MANGTRLYPRRRSDTWLGKRLGNWDLALGLRVYRLGENYRWITDKWSGPVWGGIGRTRQDVRWMIFLQVRKSSRSCGRGLLILWVIPERSSAFWRRLQLGLYSALWVDEGSSHHLWWKEYEMYPKRVYIAVDGWIMIWYNLIVMIWIWWFSYYRNQTRIRNNFNFQMRAAQN